VAEQTPNDDENLYSPDEMKEWLRLEIRQIRLASARRIEEASSLVEAYASGDLNRLDANERLGEYEEKWGEVAKDLEVASELHEQAVNAIYRLNRSHTRNKGGKTSR
jgi:hypothetical protein